MLKYNRLNNFMGWAVFLIALITYLLTLEPTASFWDCGEFISAAYKLEVGHPPGAPFFLLVAKFFTLFAGGNTAKIALMVNSLSAVVSALTILFLFWTITHLSKKGLGNVEAPNPVQKFVILTSGISGALVYTYSDTFWFSAVEGEVYASSSFLTALVFWAILKWENNADKDYSNRWLILIAYIIGLSIGVHLLNLLAIPSIVLIFYFKKYKKSKKGMLLALLISALILGSIMFILIPGMVKLAGAFELLFVNVFGMPYFSGVLFYLTTIFTGLFLAIYITNRQRKVLSNTILLAVTVILIGYSSYALVVIRSQANPPMDQNNPETVFNLLSYLNREQYGDHPIVYGQYFNAPANYENNGSPIYTAIGGKYKVLSYKPRIKYDNNFKTFFPRIYSNQEEHIAAYLQWTGLKEGDIYKVMLDQNGNERRNQYGDLVYDHREPKRPPGFAANARFFMQYQIGFMYFRYFMWNFSGRQNDFQSSFSKDILKGNWITGFKSLDATRLGDQKHIPEKILKNRAMNNYFLLPLVLGIIGIIFQYREDKNNFWVVLSLFFLTGLAIVIYLNQPPLQPRERDYAYAGSFYSFAIWIGLAVSGLYQLSRKIPHVKFSKRLTGYFIAMIGFILVDLFAYGSLNFTPTAFILMLFVFALSELMIALGKLKDKFSEMSIIFAILLICLPVPIIMAAENWDDHNRSDRTMAVDFAYNYLNSCEKNAVLYTNGDNDTFPLWYAQEVEGIRTDIRVINLSYLAADWYIKQMTQRAYESPPLKISLTEDQYRQGNRDVVYLYDYKINGYVNLKEALQFVASNDPSTKTIPGVPQKIDFIPQHKFSLLADSAKVFNNGTVQSNYAGKFQPELTWEIKNSALTKNLLMVLDILATNDWERPLYFAFSVSDENFLNLNPYLDQQGLAYRIIPAVTTDSIGAVGGINTSLMYENFMHKFKWGGIENPKVYLDENSRNVFNNMRRNFDYLAKALILENKIDSAKRVLEKCTSLIPDERIPYDLYMLGIVENYYLMHDVKKAHEVAQLILKNVFQDVNYLITIDKKYLPGLLYERRVTAYVLRDLIKVSESYQDKLFSAQLQQRIEQLEPKISQVLK